MRRTPLPTRRLWSIVLALVLACSLVPVMVVPAQAATYTLSITPTNSGSATADTGCPAQVPGGTAHCPGLDTDLSAVDKILRTGDTATVRFEYASSGADTQVKLSGTLTGGATWGAKPAACLTWSVSGATFTCGAPDLTSGSLNAIAFTLSVPNSVGDGTSIGVTGNVRSATNTTPTPGTSTVSYVSSARPEWNLDKAIGYPLNRVPAPAVFRDPSGQVGWLTIAPVMLKTPRAYGNSGLPANGVTFTDDLSGFGAAQSQTRLVTWGGYGTGCGRGNATANGGTVFVTLTNQLTFTGSGTASCSQAAPGGPINVTLSGIDTNSTFGYGGYGIYWIATFTPASALPVGSTVVRDRVENFDPDDRQGVNNFGAGGTCTGTTDQPNCEPLTDNTRSTTITNSQAASSYKNLVSAPTNPQATFSPGNGGGFQVDPGTTLGSTPVYQNTGSLVQNNVTVCDKIDSTTQTLTAWPNGQYAIPVTTGSNSPTDFTNPPAYAPASTFNNTSNFLSDPAAYSIEYGVGDYGTTAPADGGTLYNTLCRDADSPIGWFSSPTDPAISAYAQARGLTALEAVTKVRVRLLQPLQPGSQVAVKLLTTIRTDFRANTPLADTPLFGTTQVKDDVAGRADEINSSWYKLNISNVVIRGLAPGTAEVTVSKSSNPASSVVAGSQITYSLTPRYTYAGPSSEFTMRVFDVLPPDLAYVEGSASLAPTLVVPQSGGSTLLVWDLGFAPSNTTTITYRASTSTATPNGTQLINSAVVEGRNAAGAEVDSRVPILSCTGNDTRTIPATPSVPTVKTVAYPANVDKGPCRAQGWFQRYDQRIITLANSAILGVVKTPLRSRIQVGDDDTTGARVGWTLLYRNLSSDPLSAIDGIDVLPYNGDGRTPASQFTGTLSLTGLTTTDTLSATPNALPILPDGTGQTRTGTTFYYTSATPSTINTDPNNATNLATGSTKWCLQTQFGSTGCPANLAAVTAFRVISGQLNASGGSQTVTAAFDTDGNADGNLYTNAGAVRARGLTAPGVIPPSTIQVVGAAVGGTLWDDVNDNGVIDTGETRLAGVALRLLNSSGTQVGTTTTETDGTYSFPNLRAGTYTVRVVPGAVAALYPALVPNWDSDSLFTNPDEQITVTLGEGVKDLTKNFGYSSSSLSGFVYADDNGDGQRTAADAGIAGVTITLTGTTRDGTPVTKTTLTTNTGAWSFPDLQPGTYSVSETQPSGYLDGPEALGTTGGTIGADTFTGITLGAGDKGTNYRFAEYTPTALSGRVFSDDGNGTFDATDTGIGNVTVRLTGTDINGASVNRTLLTNADGTYIFTGLVPGTYTLTETQPAGYADGIDRAGPAGGTVSNDRISAISIPSAGTYPGYTFAELRPAITLAKTAQSLPADTEPGPYVPVGNDVTYTLVATNTGAAPLTNITFDDAVPGGDCAVVPTLAPGATTTCTITVPAEAGQHQNLAKVTGTTAAYTGPDGATSPGIDVSATDLANYFGVSASLQINKRTQTLDPSAAPGPAILVGRPVRWTYQVSVPAGAGAVPITNITVTDDQIAGSQIVCPSGANTIASVAPGQSVTCAATGVSVAGQYSNLGRADGFGPSTTAANGTVSPLPVSATDRSWYYGSQSGVEITKTVNGQRATTGNGPLVDVGSTVRFAYTVNNIGNTPLTDVTVTDDRIAAGDIDCGNGSNVVPALAQGATVVCRASESAQPGLNENTGTVRGVGPQVTEPDGTVVDINVVDDQRAAYTGIAPSIDVTKTVQGQDANAAPGPVVPVGQDVVFVYTVVNTGDVALTDVEVTDDKIAAGSINCDGGSNVVATLAPSGQARCVATVPAAAGQQTNIGTATGTAPATVDGDGNTVPGAKVTDTDQANYFGGAAAVTLAKQTNGVDGATAPGPLVVVGDAVRWTYTVTNTGNLALSDVTVIDDPTVSINCGGGSPTIATLAVDAAPVTCVATGVATVGQFANTATVTGQTPGTIGSDGTPADGAEVSASDTSHYFGLDGGLSVEKRVQGQDADTAPGPYVPVGDTLAWTFVVTNLGNAELSDIAVNDPDLTVTCPTTPLAVGGSTTCTASGTAAAGQHSNTATASGNTPARTGTDGSTTPGKRLTSIADPAYYFGSAASVALVKRTQGRDVSGPPGPSVQVGEPVRWTYKVSVPTGAGAVRVSDITVTDNQIGGTDIVCPGSGANTIAGLDPGQSETCTATGVSVAGQYTNEGTASGSGPEVTAADGTTSPVPVSAADSSWYFGSQSGVSIAKTANGQSATTGGGPLVPVGSTVRFAYTVDNTGNTPLTAVTVTDDRIVAGDIDCGNGSNVVASLAVGASVTCRATEEAQSGLHENTGTVRAVGPSVVQPDGTVVPVAVNGSQRAAYTGIAPEITVLKTVQGQAADTAPGPVVPVGDDVAFVYTVTNNGNTTLTDVTVTDDQLADTDIDCGSGSNAVASLASGDEVTCTATATATAGQYANVGTAKGTAPSTTDGDGNTVPGVTVTDTDEGHYFGGAAAITLTKQTNGLDGADAPGPLVVVGDAVRWTYTVTNTGNLDLTDVTVVDDPAVSIDCGNGSAVIATLAVDAAPVTCVATGVATVGQFENTATVTGQTPTTTGSDGTTTPGVEVSVTDTSHYFGLDGGLSVEKRVQEQDADTAPGPYVPVGDTLSWTFVVTNIGNAELSDIAVDDPGLTVDCPTTPLPVGDATTCTASSVAVAGEHTNTATASGTTPDRTGTDGSTVPGKRLTSIADPASYFGGTTGLTLTKRINASTSSAAAPGVLVPAGSTMKVTVAAKNTGNAALTDVTVTDDQIGAGLDCGDGNNVIATLAAGATVTCTGEAAAPTGAYTNTVTGEGTAPAGTDGDGNPVPGATVTAEPDTAYAYGFVPSLTIEKTANGEDADTAPGPRVDAGSTVSYAVTVSNPDVAGAIAVSNVNVTDLGVDLACELDGSPITGTSVTSLAVGATLSCTADVTAEPGQQVNNAQVSAIGPVPIGQDGTPGARAAIAEADPAYYFGATAALTITTVTNGAGDAADDTAPGPNVKAGAPVRFTYFVTNPDVAGASTLTDVALTDPGLTGATISCAGGGATIATLTPGDTVTCVADGDIAKAGQYASTVTAVGTVSVTSRARVRPALAAQLTATDQLHYFGVTSGLSVVTEVNGIDKDDGTGVTINTATATVTWTITNTGNRDLTDLAVDLSDLDVVGALECTPALSQALPAGGTITCTAKVAIAPKTTERGLGDVTARGPVTSDVAGAAVVGQEVTAADAIVVTRSALSTKPGGGGGSGNGGGNGNGSGGSGNGSGSGLPDTGSPVTWWMLTAGPLLLLAGLLVLWRRRRLVR